MNQGLRQGSLDVGEYAKILLGPAPQLGAGAPKLECLIELFPGCLDQATFEIEPGDRIECLCREHRMTQSGSRLIAALTEFSCQSWLIAPVVDHSETAQGLSESGSFTFPSGRVDSISVTLYGLSHGSRSLIASGLL
jgi:hypothetical protein